MIWLFSKCSHSQTPHIAKKVRFFFSLSPWLASSLEPPVCTASLSLLLPSQSQTQWHPFTHPFMSHGQWLWAQGHTFQSESCFSVLSGLDRGVCSASEYVCLFFLCVLWVAAAVFETIGPVQEQKLSCLFVFVRFKVSLGFSVLSFDIFSQMPVFLVWMLNCEAVAFRNVVGI